MSNLQKYQKPLARNLGDLISAEGNPACSMGFDVRPSVCSVGSNYTICTTGGGFRGGVGTCTNLGRSAGTCLAGDTAL